MNNTNLDLIRELGLEDAMVFRDPDYDDAIIGYDVNNQKVIYDYEKMINHLITKHSMDTEEAIEFIDYNTIRTIPYMGVNAPIIMQHIE